LIDSRRTPGGCLLDGGDPRPELTYLEWEEALALFAEIKGLSLEQALGELRDVGLLESAMVRPRNDALYGGADIAAQAASLLWGIAEHQPFVDGNKRVALVVTLTFLEINGYRLDLTEAELVELMYRTAEGLTPAEIAVQLRRALQLAPQTRQRTADAP